MDFAKLISIAGGFAEARAIQIALKLAFFDALTGVERDAEALAAALRCEPRATMLLGNAMVAVGLCTKNDGRYALTETAKRFLLQCSPEYLGGMILFEEALWDMWGKLEESVRSGAPVRTLDMFQTRMEETRRFIRAMDSLVRARGDAIWTADHIDLAFARTIVDLGGGAGTYLVEFLRRWPNLTGAIYDLKSTLEVSRRVLGRHEPWARERIEFRQVDYNLDEFGEPVDVFFISNIIHGENEATNAALMRKCFGALNSGGLIIVKDHILNPELTEPAAGAIFALYLLMASRGRDYSFEEVAQWLGEAGFADIRLEHLPAPPFTSSIVLANKP